MLFWARFRSIATVLSGTWFFGCVPEAPARPPPSLSSNASASAILPSDLDVVIWLDIERLRALFLGEPERQLLAVLRDYGILTNPDATANDEFYVELLRRTTRLFVGCRPHVGGCRDPVVLARGDYRKFDLRKALGIARAGLDLGGGWLRYDRNAIVDRSGLARLYWAPPDRLILVSYTELDAVERSVERRAGIRGIIPKETGLASITIRPNSIARLVEPRSPAAARWLNDAQDVELVLDRSNTILSLVLTFGFPSQERAERAAQAFRLIWTTLMRQERSQSTQAPIEVIGADVIVRLALGPPPGGRLPEPSPRRWSPDRSALSRAEVGLLPPQMHTVAHEPWHFSYATRISIRRRDFGLTDWLACGSPATDRSHPWLGVAPHQVVGD